MYLFPTFLILIQFSSSFLFIVNVCSLCLLLGTTGQTVSITCSTGYSGGGIATCGTNGQFITEADCSDCDTGYTLLDKTELVVDLVDSIVVKTFQDLSRSNKKNYEIDNAIIKFETNIYVRNDMTIQPRSGRTSVVFDGSDMDRTMFSLRDAAILSISSVHFKGGTGLVSLGENCGFKAFGCQFTEFRANSVGHDYGINLGCTGNSCDAGSVEVSNCLFEDNIGGSGGPEQSAFIDMHCTGQGCKGGSFVATKSIFRNNRKTSSDKPWSKDSGSVLDIHSTGGSVEATFNCCVFSANANPPTATDSDGTITITSTDCDQYKTCTANSCAATQVANSDKSVADSITGTYITETMIESMSIHFYSSSCIYGILTF